MNKDVAVVLRSFTKIQELKLAMNLIYDKNRSPSSEEYRKGILTRISNDTHTARRRVEGVRNQMNVAWNTPEAVMMRNLRTRLADLNRTSSKYNQNCSMFFNQIISNLLSSFCSVGFPLSSHTRAFLGFEHVCFKIYGSPSQHDEWYYLRELSCFLN